MLRFYDQHNQSNYQRLQIQEEKYNRNFTNAEINKFKFMKDIITPGNQISKQQRQIRHLMQQVACLTKEKDQQQGLFRNKIIELQNYVNERDQKIIFLSQRISSLTKQNQTLQKNKKTLESYLKERGNAINSKTLKIAQLEEELKIGEEIIGKQYASRVKELQKIVSMQQEQINQELEKHQKYIKLLEQVYQNGKTGYQQKQLLYQFNKELQRQIEQVENTNQFLITQNEQTNKELVQQNEQGNDLLCQVQGFMEWIEESA